MKPESLATYALDAFAKSKIILFVISVLLFQSAYSQHKRWLLGNKEFKFENGTIQTSRTFNNVYSEGSNVTTDSEGNIIFYIKNYRLYDKYDNVITTIPYLPNNNIHPCLFNEITVVPFLESNNCVQRYYLFYPYYPNDLNVRLQAKVISVSKTSAKITVEDLYLNNSITIAQEGGIWKHDLAGTLTQVEATCALAVSRPIWDVHTQFRYLYFVSGYSVQKIKITSNTSVNFGLIPAQTIFSKSDDQNFEFATYEADLTIDGDKLAWALNDGFYDYGDVGFTLERSRFFAIGLNSNGDFNGYKKRFVVGTGGVRQIRGIEFSPDGNSLYFSPNLGTNLYPPSSANTGIYKYDLTTDQVVLRVNNSENFAASSLEFGPDGKLYAVNSSSLGQIDVTSTNPTLNVIANFDNTFTSTGYTYVNNTQSFFFLPDQIDGELEGGFVSKFPFFDNPISPTTGEYLDFQILSGGTSTYNLNPAYFNGKTTIKIKGDMRIANSSTSVIFSDLVIEFSENSHLYIESGAQVSFNNCTLKGLTGLDCDSKMWGGIVLNGDNTRLRFNSVNDNANKVILRDAIVGVKLNSGNCIFNSYKCSFTANETSVKVLSGYLDDFYYNSFNGKEVLLNPVYGSNNGYEDGQNRSISGVELENGITLWGNNSFIGGQFGVRYTNKLPTSFSAQQFTDHKKASLYLANSSVNPNPCSITSNTFSSSVKGIEIENVNNSNVQINNNTFNVVSGYGIDIHDTKNCVFKIGTTQTAYGNNVDANTFTHTGTAAIYMHNNAGYDRASNSGTEIYIYYNNISASQKGATGIWITESTGGNQKYKAMRVAFNQINNTSWGITTTNVVGANKANTKIYDYNLSSHVLADITKNYITINTNQYYINYTGITPIASPGLSFVSNEVNPKTIGNRSHRSFNFTNCANVLFYDNVTNTGFGLYASGNMLNSNYYCNKFNRAYEAIRLTNHVLRGATSPSNIETHGELNSEARVNQYLLKPKGAVDIYVYQSYSRYNNWIFSNSGNVPNIRYSSTQPTIQAGTGPDLCGTTTGPINPKNGDAIMLPQIPSDGVMLFNLLYYNQQQYKIGNQRNPIDNANIIAIIDAENLIADKEDYRAAYDILTNINTSSENELLTPIINDYKTMYLCYVNYLINRVNNRSMCNAHVNTLLAIAQKNALTQSPAALSARAILWDEKQMRIEAETFTINPVIAGNVLDNCNLTSLYNIPVYLQRADGQLMSDVAYTDSTGYFEFNESVFTNNDTSLTYKLTVTLSGGNTLYSPLAKLAELATLSNYQFNCSTTLGKKGNNASSNTNDYNNNTATNSFITVYPNPSKGVFSVSGLNQTATAHITDMLGKTVVNSFTIKDNTPVVCNQLQAGVYLLHVKLNDTTQVYKITIK